MITAAAAVPRGSCILQCRAFQCRGVHLDYTPQLIVHYRQILQNSVQHQIQRTAARQKQEAKLSLGWPTVLPHSRLSMVVISDCCWIASPAVFDIFGPEHTGVMTVTIQVLWRHRSRDRSISHRPFPICFFRQFFGKTHCLATIHSFHTDDRRTQHCSISAKNSTG